LPDLSLARQLQHGFVEKTQQLLAVILAEAKDRRQDERFFAAVKITNSLFRNA